MVTTLGAVGIGQFYSRHLAADAALLVALVVLTLGWLTYSGLRYCRGR